MKEILDELLLVLRGKSLDVLVPPIVFLIAYSVFMLDVALVLSIVVTVFFFIKRIRNNEQLGYAIVGLFGTLFAVSMVIIGNNANNIFLPDLIGTSVLVVITVVTLIMNKPLAAWVSHITRGWEKTWFFRKDVLPAYREVTYFWLLFFVVRLVAEIYVYINSSVETYALFNLVSGLPVTIVILVISYIYGIWRLHQLGGPGVDEFTTNAAPPYRGQRKGF